MKTTKKTKIVKKTTKKSAKKPAKKTVVKYYQAIGRRKTSVARIRLFTQGDKTIMINGKPYKEYFPDLDLQQIVSTALDKMKALDKFMVSAKVKGGGVHAQAEAVRHGIARARVTCFSTTTNRAPEGKAALWRRYASLINRRALFRRAAFPILRELLIPKRSTCPPFSKTHRFSKRPS